MLSDFHSNDDILSTSFGSFAKKFNVFSILAKCGAKKLRGVSVSVVFAYLFSIAFKHTTVNRDQKGRKNPQAVGKDCVHRFLQSPRIDWNRFTALLAAAIIRLEFKPIYEKSSDKVANRRCLVIDDSSFKRNRSKKVELLATCFDTCPPCVFQGFPYAHPRIHRRPVVPARRPVCHEYRERRDEDQRCIRGGGRHPWPHEEADGAAESDREHARPHRLRQGCRHRGFLCPLRQLVLLSGPGNRSA